MTIEQSLPQAVDEGTPQVVDIRTEVKTVSLRTVFKFIGRGVIVGAGSWVMAQLGMDVPEYDASEDSIAPPNAGWYETQLFADGSHRPEFISSTKGGHKEYIRYFAFHDPILRSLLKSHFEDLKNYAGAQRPQFGDMLKLHVQRAKEKLEFAKKPSSNEDALHIALYSMAALYSNFFTYGEINTYFGVDMGDAPVNPNRQFDLPPFAAGVPVVFAHNPELGPDKAQHAANHMFLYYMMEYFTRHKDKMQDARRIPNAVTWLTGIFASPAIRAYQTDLIGQWVWEAFETKAWAEDSWKQKKWSKAPVGLLDEDVDNDFKANAIGAYIGYKLSRRTPTDIYLESIYKMLNEGDYPEDLAEFMPQPLSAAAA